MTEKDDYLDVIDENWDKIVGFYSLFEGESVIMEYDLPEHLLYAYPYEEYLKSLSKRSQVSLKAQFEDALANDKLVLFIRDSDKKKLRSYIFCRE